ncbi:hypothetical protein MXMO3_01689 [Maritalea myrionectae]|uniref:Uncharacterized protein n=1 Tax=Maritalea myrionectae TaxID=454601 RepID=A0A2R4ME43_9HYPH|nr:hypothetical protein MXMO3_01689 [Maritalea myrionectae]
MIDELQWAIAKKIYECRNGAGCVPWHRLPALTQNPYLSDAAAAMSAMKEMDKRGEA